MLAVVESIKLNFQERDLSDDGAELTECCRDSKACTAVTCGENFGWDLLRKRINFRLAWGKGSHSLTMKVNAFGPVLSISLVHYDVELEVFSPKLNKN